MERICELKRQLADLQSEQNSLAAAVKTARRALMEAEAKLRGVTVVVHQLEGQLKEAADAPVPEDHPLCVAGGRATDPTTWLPDELLVACLIYLTASDLFLSARLVCRRWYHLVRGDPVAKVVWAGRWGLYASGALHARWLEVGDEPADRWGSDDDYENTQEDGMRFGDIASVAMSPCEARLYVGTWNDVVKVVDTRTLEVVTELRGHRATVSALVVTPSGTLVSGAFDGTMRVWGGDGTPLRDLVGHKCGVTAIIAGKTNTLYSGAFNGVVLVWEGEATRPTRELTTGDRSKVVGLAQRGDALVCATETGVVTVWRGPDFACDTEWRVSSYLEAFTVAPLGLRPDVVWLVLSNHALAWVDIAGELPLREHHIDRGAHEFHACEARHANPDERRTLDMVAVSSDGQTVATAECNGSINIWVGDGVQFSRHAVFEDVRLDPSEPIEGLVMGASGRLVAWQSSGVIVW